jgi:hypothetical protein
MHVTLEQLEREKQELARERELQMTAYNNAIAVYDHLIALAKGEAEEQEGVDENHQGAAQTQ